MEKEEEEIRNELGSLPPHIPPIQPNIPSSQYFDELPGKVIQRWKEDEKKILHRKVLLRRWMAIAAATFGLVIGGWWFFQKQQVPASTPEITLSSSEAYQYVMDNISDFEGLLEHVQWPNEEKIMIPDSSAAQEYLLEELQDKDIEQIF